MTIERKGGKMKIQFTVYPLRSVLQRAGDAALDAAAALREGASAAERRAGGVLSRLRLEREIHDLQEEIGLQMQAVGEMMYASHRGRPAGSGQVQEILEYVDGLHEEMEAHRRELETLRGFVICSGCGEGNSAGSLYCQNCGKPLSRG